MNGEVYPDEQSGSLFSTQRHKTQMFVYPSPVPLRESPRPLEFIQNPVAAYLTSERATRHSQFDPPHTFIFIRLDIDRAYQ